ncbi:hypothetical protein ACJIZ3_022357 [Penstemon smallii]|uniref:Uncharacterized protein n=1 Tax=Penstemon smallii TaxID=265156 RepID=A0ABD3TMC0_9LAMI
MEIMKIYFLVLTLTTLFFLPTPTTARGIHTNNITAVFAFGDSILDPGNNNGLLTIFQANHPPYGRDFPGRIPSGRFSNGKLTTDFIVSDLGLKELLPAYLDPTLTDRDLLTGASFASAGTGLDDLTASEAHVLSMGTQLGYFERALRRMERAVGSEEAGRIVENALFVVGAGTNDMMYNFYGLPIRTTYTLSGYQDLLLRNLETVIRRLHTMGARRIGVMGLPPIGCLPVQVTIGSLMPSLHMFQRMCINHQNVDSQSYNAKLRALTSRLQRSLSGSRVAYVDIYNPMMNMITNPAAYGFEKTLDGCCGIGSLEMGPLCNALAPTCPNPSNYLFWDAAHPTQATYSTLANHFEKNVLPSLLA